MYNLDKIINLMTRIDEGYREYNLLINEDKRGKAAKKHCYNILQQYPLSENPEELYDRFMKEFYHDDTLRKGPLMRLAPLFLRLAIEQGFDKGGDISRLKEIFNYLYGISKNGYDLKNIDINMSYDELENTVGEAINSEESSMDDRINNTTYQNTGYKIIGPLSYEEANYYGRLSGDPSCANSEICYTQNRDTWNNFTRNGKYSLYIALAPNWQSAKPQHDDESNSPYDTYGLSMIFVIVDVNGKLAYCNTRWNHKANYDKVHCDHALNKEEISQIVGQNFNETFKADSDWHKELRDIMQRLANGESAEELFDGVGEEQEGFRRVVLSGRCNFLNNNNQILSKNWYDNVDDFVNGIAMVELNQQYNFLTSQDTFTSKVWFDWVFDSLTDMRMVEKNDKYNFINAQGIVISNQWYFAAYDFKLGFAKVKQKFGDGNYKVNFIDRNGNLISNQWFDMAGNFNEKHSGYAEVKLNSVWHLLDINGQIH